MGAKELTPISSLGAEELLALEAELSQYQGPGRVIRGSELKAKFAAEPRKAFSFPTGLERLDKAIGNLETGELVAIGGPTKNGKTTFCQTWTINLHKQGVGTLWFSFEVPMRQFLQQLPESCDFYTPEVLKISDKDWVRRRIIEAKLKYNARVVFIDNLHHLVDFQSLRNISMDLGVVIRDLKRMAVELNVCIVVLCHSKKGENPNGGAPPEVSEWDLRDSSFIAQESDTTIMVQRKWSNGKVSNQAIAKVCLHRRTGTMGRRIHIIRENNQIYEDGLWYLDPTNKGHVDND